MFVVLYSSKAKSKAKAKAHTVSLFIPPLLMNFTHNIFTKSSTVIKHIQNFRGVENKEKKLLIIKNGQKHLWHIKITRK